MGNEDLQQPRTRSTPKPVFNVAAEHARQMTIFKDEVLQDMDQIQRETQTQIQDLAKQVQDLQIQDLAKQVQGLMQVVHTVVKKEPEEKQTLTLAMPGGKSPSGDKYTSGEVPLYIPESPPKENPGGTLQEVDERHSESSLGDDCLMTNPVEQDWLTGPLVSTPPMAEECHRTIKTNKMQPEKGIKIIPQLSKDEYLERNKMMIRKSHRNFQKVLQVLLALFLLRIALTDDVVEPGRLRVRPNHPLQDALQQKGLFRARALEDNWNPLLEAAYQEGFLDMGQLTATFAHLLSAPDAEHLDDDKAIQKKDLRNLSILLNNSPAKPFSYQPMSSYSNSKTLRYVKDDTKPTFSSQPRKFQQKSAGEKKYKKQEE